MRRKRNSATVTCSADLGVSIPPFRDRSAVIVDAREQWKHDRSRGHAKCSTYVNVALAEEDHEKLTAEERTWCNER